MLKFEALTIMPNGLSEKKIIVAAILVAAIIITVIVAYNMQDDKKDDDVQINENVLSHDYFSIVYEPTETYSNGSYFIIEENGQLKMKIIADINVGAEDFGGISFNFIEGFKVTDITCDFGDGPISKHVSLWTTGDHDKDITSYVEIEKGIGTQPIGGGTGTVEIELEIAKGIENPYFLIGVGSMISDNGTVIINPVKKEIPVELD